MYPDELPREIKAVLLEEFPVDVVVTWSLGDLVTTTELEYWGYEVFYYGLDDNGGKRFGVRFSATSPVTAHVFDNASSTQANYVADHVVVRSDAVVVHYRDASIGLREIGPVKANAHVNGVDMQTNVPVTVIR